MKIQRGYKVKLYPNKEQEQQLLKIIGATRFVYNYFLDARKSYYAEYGKTLSYKEMSRDLTKMRHEMWLADIRTEPLSQSLRRLDGAFKTFFKNKKGFPRYKSRKNNKQSFQKHKDWKLRGDKIQI